MERERGRAIVLTETAAVGDDDGQARALLDTAPEPSAIVVASGEVVVANLAWERHPVLATRAPVGASFENAVPAASDAVAAVLDGSVRRCQVPCETGFVTATRLPGPDGRALLVLGDESVNVAIDDRLEEARQRFELAFAHAPIGMAITDLVGRFVQVNDALCRMTGREPEELVGLDVRSITHAGDADADLEQRGRLLSGEVRSYQVEKRFLHADGAVVWALVAVSAVCSPDGEPQYLLQHVQDVTDRKQAEARLSFQAMHDMLTGLPNRLLFMDRLEGAIGRCGRRGGSVALLFADLDNFKVVNDSLGHDAGDTLLVEVAARLREAVRPGDSVARLGGDEFAICCEDVHGEEEARRIAGRVNEVLRRPVSVAGRLTPVSASIGLALTGDPDVRPEALLRDADTAMYRAKERGRDRHELFDDSLRARAVARLELERQLREALDTDQLTVWYQPLVDLRTNRVVSVEALARWHHPDRGLVLPSEFVPLAEETGLVVALGTRVLDEACRQAAAWRRTVAPDVGVSVNLSARQVARVDVVDVVRGSLARTGLPPSALHLEVTETVVMETTGSAARALRDIRTLGVGLALDDFGTGHSSLAMLKQLPVDIVKLDRGFVAGLHPDRTDEGTPVDGNDAAIVAAVTALAHALGLTAVAEGVETPEQLAALRRLGCDVAQGFLLAPPMPAAELLAYLATSPPS